MQAPVKSDPILVRAFAALPAAGAFDAKAIAIPLGDYSECELRMQYTEGAVGGFAVFMVFVCDTESGLYFPRSIDQNTLTVTTPTASTNIFQSVKALPVSAAAPPTLITFGPFSVSTAKWMKVLFAEAGVVATPGSLQADCVLGGRQLA